MKRNYLLFFITVIFAAGFWYGKTMLFDPLPSKVRNLEKEQTLFNEKLITAQILAEEMDRVYTIFEKNMAVNANTSLKEDASIEFLNMLTDMLDKLEITVLHLKPGRKEDKGNYTFIPYEVEIKCTFEQFGKFITELEKSDRLIRIDEFVMNNGIERLTVSRSPETLMNQVVSMKLSTITLNKISEK